MKLITRITKLFLIATMALSACQSAPKTDLERINALKQQVQTDAKTMDELASKDLVQIEKDFFIGNGYAIPTENANASHNCNISIFGIDIFLLNAVVVFYFFNTKLKCRKHFTLNKKNEICIFVVENHIRQV